MDVTLNARRLRGLRDITEGHITLYAQVRYFDPQTGERLAEPVLLGVGYDRAVGTGPDWWRPYLDLGLIALPAPGLTRCTVTDAGRRVLAAADKEN